MPNVVMRGVDYSATPPGAAALKAAGIELVMRYAVLDYRGLKQYEKDDLTANGIEIGMVYESYEARVREGFNAGVYDATYARSVLIARGLPADMVIYFAVDYDMTEVDFAAFFAYLRGAATVIGMEKVGVYGGWLTIEAAANFGIKWLWQTSAWAYRSGAKPDLHPRTMLYQYEYNYYINGTNCDKTDSFVDNFGQASKFDGIPDVIVPTYPAPDLPDFYDRVNGQSHPSAFDYKGRRYYPVRQKVVARSRTLVRTSWEAGSDPSGEDVLEGHKIAVDWITKDDDGHMMLVNGNGYYRGSKFDPMPQFPKRGK